MSNQVKKEERRKPTWIGLAGYIAVIAILGLAAIFAPAMARLVKGPVLCIYVGVLPKYILGLAFILAGIDGTVYAIRMKGEIRWLEAAASGFQAVLLVIFLLFVFPLSLREGVPPGQTYNLMRILISVMFLVILWDFISEMRKLLKKSD